MQLGMSFFVLELEMLDSLQGSSRVAHSKTVWYLQISAPPTVTQRFVLRTSWSIVASLVARGSSMHRSRASNLQNLQLTLSNMEANLEFLQVPRPPNVPLWLQLGFHVEGSWLVLVRVPN